MCLRLCRSPWKRLFEVMLLVLLTAALWFSVAYSSPCKPLPIQVSRMRARHTCRAACLLRHRDVTGCCCSLACHSEAPSAALAYWRPCLKLSCKGSAWAAMLTVCCKHAKP